MKLTELDEVSSTNTWLKERCEEHYHGDAVTALRQTAGRGRLGHTWLDSEGMLALSVLLKSPPGVDTLTLRVSIAVCRAIEQFIGEQLFVKWTNDIILREHKLCGILCESAVNGDSIDIICGVGVNISQSADFVFKLLRCSVGAFGKSTALRALPPIRQSNSSIEQLVSSPHIAKAISFLRLYTGIIKFDFP